MSWWNPLKAAKKGIENPCHVCGINQLPVDPAVLRLKVQEGTAEMHICDDCAEFFDKSAEVLSKHKRNNTSNIKELEE